MRSEDLDEMQQLPLFSGVEAVHVDAMLKASFLQRFPACVELVREGEPADFLHVVVDGQVELFSAYRERETTVGVLGPGKSFIVAAVLLDKIYLKSARALSPSRILMIPADAVRRYFQEDSAFSRSMAIELAFAYRSVVKELKNQKLRSSLERLANWLLAHHVQVIAPGRFELPFDKKVLASRLGMAPEVLSRSFAALIPYSVVVSGAFVQLNDLGALTKLAHPSTTIDDPSS
ncbi:MAG: cyclic nucleotide-binding domain-containing protein [Beijerinckiaceae bacterium]